MASTISAGTTSGTAIAITGDTTGNLAFTTSAGTYTQTMPNATGTIMVSGNMPAFSAYPSASQSISASTSTKLQVNTKTGANNIAFDTASYYDTTNYRFLPLVAGYYQVNGVFNCNSVTGSNIIAIYKNGSELQRGTQGAIYGAVVSCIVYLNGSTDYIELYGYTSGATTINAGPIQTYFQASMVRSA